MCGGEQSSLGYVVHIRLQLCRNLYLIVYYGVHVEIKLLFQIYLTGFIILVLSLLMLLLFGFCLRYNPKVMSFFTYFVPRMLYY